MRITLILLAFICLNLNAQEHTKAALTSGGEFLKNNETPQSITANQSEYLITTYRSEVPILRSVKDQNTGDKRGKLNPLVYVLVFILIAIALYFITAKNKARLKTTVNLESEEDQQRKKQLWDALGETKEGE